ncbi:MAG: adenine deaminase [Firmicutes bacterium]|nr:adenine deaminase [Bacillota bacterium]
MEYTTESIKNDIKASMGIIELDLILKDVKLVNVYTNEIYPANIGIYNKRIVTINSDENVRCKEIIDCKGGYAVPGFIDSHVHIETTLLTPEALGEVIVPWGTTSMCVDPMEIANVSGIDGLVALVNDSEKLPFRLFLEVPSRVPTAPGLETTGGVLGLKEVSDLLSMDMSVSLGELDPSKILGIKDEYLGKIASSLNNKKICNGHAIGLGKKELNIYATAHLADDHESVTYEELLDRLRLGIKALVREGSSERNVEALMKGVIENKMSTENLLFCTDDKHVNDIFNEGHISYNIQKSIDLGLDPIEAIKIATINTAKHFKLEDKIGSIAPGRYADILIIKDLKVIKPILVFKDGEIVVDENGYRGCDKKEYPKELFNTVKISPTFSHKDFAIKTDGKKVKCRIIDLIKDQIINKEIQEWMNVENGNVVTDIDRDIIKISVVERYGKNGRVANGLVHGFGLKKGALAASVSHDHHNIVVVGTNDKDMELVVKEIGKMQGGFVAASDGKVLDSLALPLCGLMTTLPALEVMECMEKLNNNVKSLGCSMSAPFMSLSFISLPTVPELGLTDFGLIDVLKHKIIDLITEVEV